MLNCLKSRPSIQLLIFFLFPVSALQAQDVPRFYETVLHLQQPVVNVSSVDRVIYRWSTSFVDGQVWEIDLEDLVLELWSPQGPIYVDRIIINGVIQPMSGMPRTLGADFDIFWRFDLDTLTLEQMANVNQTLIESTTGAHFDVHDSISIPDDGRVSVKAYIDGVNQDPHTDQLDTQATHQMIFADDFETGNLNEWSSSSP